MRRPVSGAMDPAGGAHATADAAHAYEHHAHAFLAGRDVSGIGARVIRDWCATLPPGATLIELACGGGYPVTRVLREAGLRVWAVDSSPTLLATFALRFPEIPVQCAKVQTSDFFGRTFDAAIAVGLIFLLPEAEQVALIARVAQILEPGGRFLFMAPVEQGEWQDLNTGLGCRSLGQAAYEGHLSDAGFRVVATFVDKGANHYYDAQRVR